MKGKADLIQIFKPEKMVFKGGVERKMIEHNGRAEELAKLRKMFAMLHTYGAGGLIILNGERGSGKGELVKSLANAGKTTCMQVLTGKEDSAKKVGAGEAVELPDVHVSPEDEEILERAPAFAAWHQVFEKALKLVVTKRLGTDGAKSATPSTLRSTEAKVVRELLEAHVVTSPTHLGYLHELNAVFGRVVVPAPRGYQPPQASTRARETAQLAVALLTEIAKDFHLLILLHIVTSSNTSVALSMDSWKVANHVARAAAQRKPPDKTLMLVIVSRSTMFSTNNADVEEIVSLASDYLDPIVPFADEKRILVLDPLNERMPACLEPPPSHPCHPMLPSLSARLDAPTSRRRLSEPPFLLALLAGSPRGRSIEPALRRPSHQLPLRAPPKELCAQARPCRCARSARRVRVRGGRWRAVTD